MNARHILPCRVTVVNPSASLWCEAEEGDVAVLENVLFAFEAILAGFAGGGGAAQPSEVLITDHFGFDKTLFEIGMDDTGGLRGFPAFLDRPSADLFFTGGEVGLQPEQGVGGFDEGRDPRIVDP